MQYFVFLSLAILSTSFPTSLAYPLASVKRDVPDNVIALDIQCIRQATSNITKRALTDVYGSFTISYGLGTPIQYQNAILDTGSSDTWVNGALSGGSDTSYHYIANNSSTFVSNDTAFDITYGGGTVEGIWATDTFTISGSELKNQSFAVVDNVTSGEGIVGLGFISNESSDQKYLNVPANLYSQGLIKKNLFSIYLDSYESASGRILFGGVDLAKFNDTLYKLPLTREGLFYVNLTGLSVGQTQYNPPDSLDVLVDSGTTFCYLPTSLASQIAANYGGEYDNSTGLYYIESKSGNEEDLEIEFSGAKIKIPASEVVIESSLVIDGTPFKPYVLAIMGSETGPYILGDTFLRSTYTVFDLADKYIAIGQATFSDVESNIVAVDGEVSFIQDASLLSANNAAFADADSSSSSGTYQTESAVEATKTILDNLAALVTATDSADAARKSASLYSEASKSYVSSKIAEASKAYVASVLMAASSYPSLEAVTQQQTTAVPTTIPTTLEATYANTVASDPTGVVVVSVSQTEVGINYAATTTAAAAAGVTLPTSLPDVSGIVSGISSLVGNILGGVSNTVSSATSGSGTSSDTSGSSSTTTSSDTSGTSSSGLDLSSLISSLTGGSSSGSSSSSGTDLSSLLSGLTGSSGSASSLLSGLSGLTGSSGSGTDISSLVSGLTSSLGSLGSSTSGLSSLSSSLGSLGSLTSGLGSVGSLLGGLGGLGL